MNRDLSLIALGGALLIAGWAQWSAATPRAVRAAPQAQPAASAANSSSDAEEPKAKRDARMKWWREARFGMFIHWGIYSVPAGVYKGQNIGGLGEWIQNTAKIPSAEYRRYADQFNPTKFNADEFVRIAKNAGMKYIVITSKHHDGFAMFKTDDPFNIVDATPFKRDVIKELAQAARKQGLRFGVYYSQVQDWNHPGGDVQGRGGRWDPTMDGSFNEYLKKIAIPQVRQLFTQVRPDVIWWDTQGRITKEQAQPLHDLLALVPGIISNNRLANAFKGDTETPEGFIPATGYPGGRDWETCMTINNTWGYKSTDNNNKSAETLIRNLIDIASKGGNYLLNVGPTAEGVIPAPHVERLAAMGKWLSVNGEAIYATGPNPFPREQPAAPAAPAAAPEAGRGRGNRPPVVWDWRATTKLKADGSGKVYVHIFQWPADGNFKITSPYRARLVKAYMLANKAKVESKVTTEGGQTTFALKLPAQQPDPIASVVCLEVKP
jgi:alpha-L-fucosidase